MNIQEGSKAMVEWLTPQSNRIVLLTIALLSGLALAEIWQLSYSSVGALACFSCCLAAIIGFGKRASP
jgi:hypothetical protein